VGIVGDVRVRLPPRGVDFLKEGAAVTVSWTARDAVVIEDDRG
jgi:hypothetical protein